jgi:hypothetical protein
MSSQSSVAEVMDPPLILFSRKPERRLSVTMMATVLDIFALVIVGPIAFHCAFIWPMVSVAISLLACAMFVSLAHMWMLTLRFWGC